LETKVALELDARLAAPSCRVPFAKVAVELAVRLAAPACKRPPSSAKVAAASGLKPNMR